MSRRAEHKEVSEALTQLPRDQMKLWDRLEKSTAHPLHRKRASELFLEVLALQNGGTEIDWPSICCAITTLTRLDKECLQARLAVGCSKSSKTLTTRQAGCCQLAAVLARPTLASFSCMNHFHASLLCSRRNRHLIMLLEIA